MQNNKINDVIQESIKNLTELIDVNTVVGSAITSNGGEVIIPVSKVTVAVLSGGGEYGDLTIFKKGNHPYSAGNGTIISLKPMAFLVKCKESGYKVLPVLENSTEKLADKIGDILDKVTSYEK